LQREKNGREKEEEEERIPVDTVPAYLLLSTTTI
jgi:hypothetical protein